MNLIKKIVILTGAGISAESGIKTFRDSGGLWENYKIEDVASPEGFKKNPDLVYDFYNQRRRQLQSCKPNDAHRALTDLEKEFDVTIITQNVDNLHEKAGSKHIIHIHGELNKVRSIQNPHLILDWEKDLTQDDRGPHGESLRPHIVWFGESVLDMDKAIEATRRADIFIVIGTSLQVFPAAGLVHYLNFEVQKYLIDPHVEKISTVSGFEKISEKASIGVPLLVKKLMNGKS